jgi:hypothetical protein
MKSEEGKKIEQKLLGGQFNTAEEALKEVLLWHT